jgi:hypothetical protein
MRDLVFVAAADMRGRGTERSLRCAILGRGSMGGTGLSPHASEPAAKPP